MAGARADGAVHAVVDTLPSFDETGTGLPLSPARIAARLEGAP